MFKKILSIVLLLLITWGLIFSVQADIGPKPTAEINILGFDQAYAFDILFKVDDDDVRVLNEDEVQEEVEYYYYKDTYPNVLNGFQDEDGYASYTLYRRIPHHIEQLETHRFMLGYVYPPDDFKIVLVLDNDEIIISDVVHKRSFNAEITFDLSDFSIEESQPVNINGVSVYLVNEPSPEEYIPWNEIITQIILGVIFTLIIELLILFVFRYNHKSSYKLVTYVNIVTQFLFHTALVTMIIIFDFFGFVFTFVIGEIIILIIEALVYRKLLKEKTKSMATIYALCANVISLVFGTLILSEVLLLIFK
ncbi:hypothetical protein KHQ88_01125 [Mycoplasmatota bacterium]|nr:hypothetical protein KHQ88_01125 [Mycoplasmatota bacterium]